MTVASLSLCKELYELSGWYDTYHYYDADDVVDEKAHALLMSRNQNCPAYDLGYLLRKLPVSTGLDIVNAGDKWVIDPVVGQKSVKSIIADTPEDAAAKLAIELHRQGVLTSERTAETQASNREVKE